MKTYITTKDIIIPAGTILAAPPKHSTRWANDYDAPVALGKDHCGYFSVDIAEAIEAGFIEGKRND
jgi:fructose/tagatose bisphosphate aldolase